MYTDDYKRISKMILFPSFFFFFSDKLTCSSQVSKQNPVQQVQLIQRAPSVQPVQNIHKAAKSNQRLETGQAVLKVQPMNTVLNSQISAVTLYQN